MKNFVIVPASEGPRREFKITWGLRASYGSSGRIYDLEEAVRAAHLQLLGYRWAGDRPQLGQTHETVAYLARTRESRSARKKAQL
jgi:hypothetical protein